MARVTCRCGETLSVTSNDPERVTCSRCGAKIRIRRTSKPNQAADESDGYVRFNCPCGRRLKVQASARPEAGKCPDCGRIVPVPDSAWSQVGTSQTRAQQGRSGTLMRTEEMDAIDLANLDRWANRHLMTSGHGVQHQGQLTTGSHHTLGVGAVPAPPLAAPLPDEATPIVKMEAGLRVCPRCGKPLHMSATVCRSCGEPVPKR